MLFKKKNSMLKHWKFVSTKTAPEIFMHETCMKMYALLKVTLIVGSSF